MAKGLRLGASRCACPGCGECFNSVAAFDRHRVPIDGHGRKLPRGYRRCMDPLEMLACGMSENSAGYWITQPMERWSLENGGEE